MGREIIENNKGFEALYSRISQVIQEARSLAYRQVNSLMVQAYWNIGRILVEHEQKGKKRAGYGEGLIAGLSGRLTSVYGRGFDPSNLRYM